jgi:preprotein translocase subunit YajC
MNFNGNQYAELIFVGIMMVLFVLITAACVYFFVRQYRKEMREKEEQDKKMENGEL